MSTPLHGDDTTTRGFEPRDEELRGLLIAQCGLSPRDVELITEVMRGSGTGFNEAALRLGLITPEDIRRALGLAPAPGGSGAGPSADLVAEPPAWRARRGLMLQSQPAGLPVRPVAELAGVSDRFSPRSERILALRTELLLTQAHTQGQACVLAVIGALPGEGRSRLAAELAIAFAQLRDSTLLVDANMRRPGLQRYFEGADGSAGLAQALAGGPLPSVQPVEGLPDLGFLSAGNVPANPLDLLSDVRFEELVAAWRDRYRFVVIDTPPVSECADALAVAHAAGRALVVCRTDQTTYDAARSMLRRLAMTQAEVVGAVLNSF